MFISKGSGQEFFMITTQSSNNGRTTDKVDSSLIILDYVTESN